MTPNHDQRQYRPDDLEWLSAELREQVGLVDDRELHEEIYEWLREVADLPSGDVLDIVDDHLTQLRRKGPETVEEYAMRRMDGDGAEHFPDSCAGCPHYGTRCPVFIDPVERDRRQQLHDRLSDATTSEKRRAYRLYGENVGCQQIAQALSDHTQEYRNLQRRGLALMEKTDVDIGFTDEADEAARLEAETLHGGN